MGWRVSPAGSDLSDSRRSGDGDSFGSEAVDENILPPALADIFDDVDGDLELPEPESESVGGVEVTYDRGGPPGEEWKWEDGECELLPTPAPGGDLESAFPAAVGMGVTFVEPSARAVRAASKLRWPPEAGVSAEECFWTPLVLYALTGSPEPWGLCVSQHWPQYEEVVRAYSVDLQRRDVRRQMLPMDVTVLTRGEVAQLCDPSCTTRATASSALRGVGPCTVPLLVYDTASEFVRQAVGVIRPDAPVGGAGDGTRGDAGVGSRRGRRGRADAGAGPGRAPGGKGAAAPRS